MRQAPPPAPFALAIKAIPFLILPVLAGFWWSAGPFFCRELRSWPYRRLAAPTPLPPNGIGTSGLLIQEFFSFFSRFPGIRPFCWALPPLLPFPRCVPGRRIRRKIMWESAIFAHKPALFSNTRQPAAPSKTYFMGALPCIFPRQILTTPGPPPRPTATPNQACVS